jgi:thiamine transport system permease protein
VTSGFTASPLHAVGTSLGIAATATVIAVSLGLALATAVTRRRRSRLGRIGEVAVLLPLGVSAVTVGFGFLIVFDAPPLDLRTSWWIVPIAHALIALPFVVRTAVPLLRAIDPHQREAAALLGASPRRVWQEIDRRVVTRAAVVAAGFAFAISLGEFGATLFIVRPETTTVPIAIYRFLARPGATNTAQAYTLATILMVLTGMIAFVGDRVQTRAARG